MIRIAVLSFWHVHAKDYAREALAHEDVELAAIWDEDSARGAREAVERGVAFVPDLKAILSDPTISGIVVTTSTADHRAVIGAAIAAGKPVFTEKVLGATLREAIDLRNQARRAQVLLSVALSKTELPEMLAMQRLIASGRMGRLTSARVRIAHGGVAPAPGQPNGWLPARFLDPEQACGGAMIDLGAHPLYLTRLLLGMPDEIAAAYGHATGKAGDDNAAALLCYDNGALGVAETSFVSKGSPASIEIHGFEASAISDAVSESVRVVALGPNGERVWSREPYDANPRPTPFDRWIDDLRQGVKPDLGLAIDLSALAEAANLAAKTGVRVRLDQLDGWDERA